MADDGCEVARAVVGERGALAFLHFRQRVKINTHTGIIPGDFLQIVFQLAAKLSNGSNDLVEGCRFDFHIEDQLSEIEIAGIRGLLDR